MASLPRVDLPVGYNFFSAAVGQIACQRLGYSALLTLGEGAASGGATPEETVRGFLKRVGRKPDPTVLRGAMLTDDDVAAVSSSELEEFAEQTIAENEYLYRERVGREEEGTPGKPRTVFGDAYLERQTGESAVDFLARAVAQQPERQAASAARTMSKFGVGQSSAGLLKSMFPLASRLANEIGASHRGSADLMRGSQVRGMPVAEGFVSGAGPSAARSLVERAATGPTPARPSDVTLEKLDERIAAFGANLDPDEQIALISVSAPAGVSFYVTERNAISREMISLKGFDQDGGTVEVVQHYTQFNVAIMGVPKVPVRRSIGFTSGRRETDGQE